MGAGLPVPAINVLVEGYLVDALWRQTGLVVELDGWEHHRGRGAFERDRARDVELRIAGYEVLRFTYLQLRDRPEQTIAAIRARLRWAGAIAGPGLGRAGGGR